MTGIGRTSLLMLAIVLLSSIAGGADDDRSSDRSYSDDRNPSKKISATLKIDDDNAKNRTDKVAAKKQEENGEVIRIIGNMSTSQKISLAKFGLMEMSSNDTISSPFEEIRFSPVNGSRENATRELTFPASADIGKFISGDEAGGENISEELPEAQELRYLRPGMRRRPSYRPPPPRRATSLNRRNVYSDLPRVPSIRPPRRPAEVKRGPTENDCTFFTQTVCLEAINYPHDAIQRSLRNNKEMAAALLTDYKTQDHTGINEELSLPLLQSENRYENNEIKRKSDLQSSYGNVEEGFTCPSVVKYARPQLARAASGIWKYIINTGEHTQTLRLEKCLNVQSSCSFISENYRSSCVQVYNYHRLLTWDVKLGLHMDIFKVPTCCSCHVHGYADIFPPHQKDPPTKPKESFPGAEFATTEQQEDFEDLSKPSSNYINKYNPASTFDVALGSFSENYPSTASRPNDLDDTLRFPAVQSNKKPAIEVNRPTFTVPGRTRTKKPSPVPRPFDKLPQQHAPNTRAPGYKGPAVKNTRQPNRPSRPFRRESISHADDHVESVFNVSTGNRFSQAYDQEIDASTRLQNGGFDEEYPEPHKRINYNYHPIIDFFKPESSMLQSNKGQLTTQSAVQNDSNSWKPMISP